MANTETISNLAAELRTHFKQGLTRPLQYRQQQLTGLAHFLKEYEKEILDALHQDIGKPAAEALAMEVGVVMAELNLTRKKLRSWMKPQKVSTGLMTQPGKSRIYTEPLGVALIIAPWNYPIQLTLVPLIGAIAAGNCVILKPSEIAPATSKLLATCLPKYIDKKCLEIVEGGVRETTELLTEYFDYIFYTGSGSVGKIVMEAAAKHLTPVTLELGGKSPCIVDKNANLDVAARRIVWGKFSNAGQSCVAPDYVLAHEAIAEKLLSCMKKAIQDFFGADPKSSPDYGRIINTNNHQRLMKLIPGSGDIYLGGDADEKNCYISPTILQNVTADAPIMVDEIFGPILPVLKIKDIDEAIAFVNKRPKPLAAYVFTDDKNIQQRVIECTSSGSVSVNYPMVQLAVPALPFGGVGSSGMGSYHGKASFETFSHCKSVLIKPTWLDLAIMYPPYSPLFKKIVRWVMM